MVTIVKLEGETPLEALERLRNEKPEYKNAVLSYAGRLDPIAEGMLLVLVNGENKKRGEYLRLDKTYEVEVLFGMGSDTGDILGMPFLGGKNTDNKDIKIILDSFIGTFTQKYPHYSSRTVKGKPLFQWAREGKIEEIEIPERTSEIYKIELTNTFSMSGEEMLRQVKERIKKVKGDFRQDEILAAWDAILKGKPKEMFDLIKMEVSCSSGTYMRTLSEAIGAKTGTNALAWRINRTGLHFRP